MPNQRAPLVVATAALLLLCCSAGLRAEEASTPPDAPPPEAAVAPAEEATVEPAGEDGAPRFRATIFGRVGFGQLDEDFFVSISPGAVFRYDPFAAAIEVPLRFRVVDESPSQDGVLRDEDWDEVSDFMRILRYAEYGRRGDPVYARLGELVGVSLGHGTIVDRYYNTILVDHYQSGVEVKVDGRYAGGELLLDNVIDPNVFGVRGFVRPLTFFGVPKSLEDLVIGFTYVSDFQAPGRIRRQPPNDTGPALVTDDGELSAETEVLSLYGVDIGWRVLQTELVDLTPYVDVNFLDRLGAGVHVGLRMDWRLPSDTMLFVRLEYRFLTRQFDAAYVNTFYEVERYRFRGGTPKIRSLTDAGAGAGRHGFYGQVSLLLFQRVTFTTTYEDAEGAGNSSLSFRLRLPWIGPVMLQAFYAKRNFAAFADIFDLDNALLLAELRVRILPFLYAYAEYAREWHLVTDGLDARYATVNDWSVGVGAAWEF